VSKSKPRARASAARPDPGQQPELFVNTDRRSADDGRVESPRRAAKPRRSVETAQTMAARQREISVSEFFTKNRHLLGFDSPRRALLTTVKEAVDNALDACEEAAILPEIVVTITPTDENRFRVLVEDNGPGIVKKQIPNIFARLLYGSKFHTLKQSRGQQGIGISAAGMYGSLTTGQPVRIVSRTSPRQPAHYYELQIDTRKNMPQISKDEIVEFDRGSGTRVVIELEGVYQKGKRSVDGYIEQSAVANPHATLIYTPPGGKEIRFERVTKDLPREAVAIKQHPYGVELGALMKLLHDTKARDLRGALMTDLSRVSERIADELITTAGLKARANPRRMGRKEAEKLFKAIPKVKIMAPAANCLSPIGAEALLAGLRERVPADFYQAVTRGPQVYRGMPFQIEVALAYGGAQAGDDLIELRRFANRVPLAYQQSACAITKGALSTDWRSYGLQQSRGALPSGPMVLVIHIASVWVPFTSESKEAIAHYPEILKEVRLGLQEVGRKLGQWLRAKKRADVESKKRDYIRKYIPHLVAGLQEILQFSDRKRDETVEELTDYLERSRKQVVIKS